MKHYRLLFYIIFTALINNSAHAEGFLANTIITALKGNTFISHIKPKDLLVVNSNKNCCKKHKNYSQVKQIHYYSADKYIKITIGNTTICCALNQKFYCAKNNKWIEAQYLTHDNHLVCADSSTITIDAIELINKPATVYALTVKKHHIYCIEPYKIIAHNYGEALTSAPFIIASSFSTAASAACSTIAAAFSIPAAPVLLTAGSVAGVIMAGVAIYFAQKQKQRNPTFTEIRANLLNATNGGSPKKPNKNNKNDDDHRDDDDDNNNENKEEYPNGKCKESDYHHQNSRKEKSPCAEDGQHCLNYSLPLDTIEGAARIAIEGNNFIILRQTSTEVYHSHTSSWSQLTDDAQALLRKRNLVSSKGKINKNLAKKVFKWK
jgi:hypothetical protein